MLDPRYKTGAVDALQQYVGTSQQGVDGGTLFSDSTGKERFTQRPAGYTEPVVEQAVTPPSFGGADMSKVAWIDKFGVPHDSQGNVITVNIPGVSKTPGVVDNTDIIRDEYKTYNSNISSGITSAENNNEPAQTSLDKLSSMLKQINITTDEELKSIDEAGASAGAAFDPLISDAVSKRKTTLASDIVRAGQRGGFENTQFAGQAALLNTTPNSGENFVGAGGLLDQSRITLDRNISYLQAQKQQAISAARAAQRQAIQTGKRSDYQNAIDLVKLSEEIDNNIATREIQKQNLAYQEKNFNLAKAKNDWDIISGLGENQTVEIGGTTYTGIKQEKPFFDAGNITSIMLKLNKGETINIKDPNTGEDLTITGIIDQAEKTTTLVDDKGYAHVINTQTGKEIAKSTTPVGKTKTQAANVSIMMNDQEKGDLAGAVSRLTGTMGDKFNTGDVVKEVRTYNTLHPGKGQQLLDTIKADVNMNDPEIKALYSSGIPKGEEDKVCTTLSNGSQVCF